MAPWTTGAVGAAIAIPTTDTTSIGLVGSKGNAIAVDATAAVAAAHSANVVFGPPKEIRRGNTVTASASGAIAATDTTRVEFFGGVGLQITARDAGAIITPTNAAPIDAKWAANHPIATPIAAGRVITTTDTAGIDDRSRIADGIASHAPDLDGPLLSLIHTPARVGSLRAFLGISADYGRRLDVFASLQWSKGRVEIKPSKYDVLLVCIRMVEID